MVMWLSLIGLIGGGLVVNRLLNRWSLPDVPVYLFLGVALGPALGLIRVPSTSPLTLNILPIAAGVILFEGGAGIPFDGLRRMWPSIMSLATLGVLLASSFMAVSLHWIWNLPWSLAAMSAIVIANTDPASVIPVLSRLSIPQSIRITMEAESAFNDTMSALTTSILMAVLNSHFSRTVVLEQSFRQIFLGLLLGLSVGYAMGTLARKNPGLSIWTEITAAFVPYLLAVELGSNGYVAAFTAGLSWRFRHYFPSPTLLVSRISTLARITVFTWLGLIMPIAVLRTHWPLALGVPFILMFAARPLTVIGSVGWIRQWHPKERLFMMWVRETGAISAVLAVQTGTLFPQWRPLIWAIVFSSILVTVGIQAPSSRFLARILGFASAQKEKMPERE
ncbi:MAG: cation:proton antiporter [Firmicutes bacterium]|nr:cation:proton antiporter [Bacillota bacterium]MCL5013170.1 cation:proton antiporter [Bacillota bacterium]